MVDKAAGDALLQQHPSQAFSNQPLCLQNEGPAGRKFIV